MRKAVWVCSQNMQPTFQFVTKWPTPAKSMLSAQNGLHLKLGMSGMSMTPYAVLPGMLAAKLCSFADDAKCVWDFALASGEADAQLWQRAEVPALHWRIKLSHCNIGKM